MPFAIPTTYHKLFPRKGKLVMNVLCSRKVGKFPVLNHFADKKNRDALRKEALPGASMPMAGLNGTDSGNNPFLDEPPASSLHVEHEEDVGKNEDQSSSQRSAKDKESQHVNNIIVHCTLTLL